MDAPQGATCALQNGVWVTSRVAATAFGLGSWFGGRFTTVLGSQHQCFTIRLTQKPLLQCCQCTWSAPVRNWELRKPTALS